MLSAVSLSIECIMVAPCAIRVARLEANYRIFSISNFTITPATVAGTIKNEALTRINKKKCFMPLSPGKSVGYPSSPVTKLIMGANTTTGRIKDNDFNQEYLADLYATQKAEMGSSELTSHRM